MKILTKEVNRNLELQELYYAFKTRNKRRRPILFFNGNPGVEDEDLITAGDLSMAFVPVTIEYYNDYCANDLEAGHRSVEADFLSQYVNRMRIISYLPEELLKRVKDKRLLALGYAEKQLKSDLLKYIAPKKAAALKKVDKSINASNEAISGLTLEKQFKEEYDCSLIELFDDDYITKVVNKGNNLTIYTDGGTKVVLKNYKVLEQEIDPTGLFIKFFELHKNKNNYELHFLLKKTADDYLESFYYVTYSFEDLKIL